MGIILARTGVTGADCGVLVGCAESVFTGDAVAMLDDTVCPGKQTRAVPATTAAVQGLGAPDVTTTADVEATLATTAVVDGDDDDDDVAKVVISTPAPPLLAGKRTEAEGGGGWAPTAVIHVTPPLPPPAGRWLRCRCGWWGATGVWNTMGRAFSTGLLAICCRLD